MNSVTAALGRNRDTRIEKLVPRKRRERFAVAADDGVKVAAELAVESRIRAALLGETKRLREQTEVGRSPANHRHSFSISFDHNFGAGAHACQERRRLLAASVSETRIVGLLISFNCSSLRSKSGQPDVGFFTAGLASRDL